MGLLFLLHDYISSSSDPAWCQGDFFVLKTECHWSSLYLLHTRRSSYNLVQVQHASMLPTRYQSIYIYILDTLDTKDRSQNVVKYLVERSSPKDYCHLQDSSTLCKWVVLVPQIAMSISAPFASFTCIFLLLAM